MNAQQIDDILSQAKIDKRGRIMNKGRLNDMLHSLHLREVKNLNIPCVNQRSEQLLDFVRWQNRQSKWITIPETMVTDYEKYLEYAGGKSK